MPASVLLLVLAVALSGLASGMAPDVDRAPGARRRAMAQAVGLILLGTTGAGLTAMALDLRADVALALVLAGASPVLPAALALSGLAGGNLVAATSLRRIMAVAGAAVVAAWSLPAGMGGVLAVLLVWGLPVFAGAAVARRWPRSRGPVQAAAGVLSGLVVLILIGISLGLDAVFWDDAGRNLGALVLFSAVMLAGGVLLDRLGDGDGITFPLMAGLRDLGPALLVTVLTGQGPAAVWLAWASILVYPLPVALALYLRRR